VANKPTKKERREASRQARIEAERRSSKQRTKTRLYVAIGAAAIIGLIAALVLAGGKKAPKVADVNALAKAAGCSDVVTPPDQGAGHIQPPQTFEYNTDPPTSGKHYAILGQAPAPTGVHTTPIGDEYQVHNLEHSAVGIQYLSSLSSPIRDDLEQFVRDHDSFAFMAPRASIQDGGVLAFTSWRKIVTCSSPTSADAVLKLARKFYEAFQGTGPEGSIAGTPLS